jgi:predicted nuclease with TOPRIM domain
VGRQHLPDDKNSILFISTVCKRRDDLACIRPRLAEVIDRLSEVTGDFTEAIDPLSEVTGGLAEVIDRLSEVTGDFTEVIDQLSEVTDDVTEVIDRLSEVTGDFTEVIDQLSEVTGDFTEAIDRLSEVTSDIAEVIGQLREASPGTVSRRRTKGNLRIAPSLHRSASWSVFDSPNNNSSTCHASGSGHPVSSALATARQTGFPRSRE